MKLYYLMYWFTRGDIFLTNMTNLLHKNFFMGLLLSCVWCSKQNNMGIRFFSKIRNFLIFMKIFMIVKRGIFQKAISSFPHSLSKVRLMERLMVGRGER